MNERAVTALGAFAALAILAALLFGGGSGPAVGRPTSVEAGPNGYAAVARWLGLGGVPVHSLRQRFHDWQAASPPVAATGNLLLTTLPHRLRLRVPERQALRAWVARGNTLLLLAALEDTPDWALAAGGGDLLGDLRALTGLAFSVPDDADQIRIGSLTEPTPVELTPLNAHPLMRGVAALHGETDAPASPWLASTADGEHAVLKLAVERTSGAAAFWQVRHGAGQVLVSGLGSLLTNRAVGAADNRQLLSNLLQRQLAADGTVIFDDMHQGLSVLYDPEAFFSDPRLGTTVLFLLGFWALYLLGSSSRLTPPATARRAPGQAEFVAGVGGFLAAKLSPVEAGRRILQRWLDDLRARGVVVASDPASALGAVASLQAAAPAADAVARLRRYQVSLQAGREVDLRALHNTIEELRRILR